MTDIVHHLRRLAAHKHDDHTVGDAGADEIERLLRKIDLKNAVIAQHVADIATLRTFARSLIDPEIFGHSVSIEIRNAARRALGLPASETTRLPMQSFNESAAKRDALTWPRGSLGEDITDGSPK